MPFPQSAGEGQGMGERDGAVGHHPNIPLFGKTET